MRTEKMKKPTPGILSLIFASAYSSSCCDAFGASSSSKAFEAASAGRNPATPLTGSKSQFCKGSKNRNSNIMELNSSQGHDTSEDDDVFSRFASFLLQKQTEIIDQLEGMDTEKATFSNDTWGDAINASGGITRVIQKGSFIEKGACSVTIIRDGILSRERASSIQGRQQNQNEPAQVKEGDRYSAAALSMVLHTRSPMVPTFRSDVRIFKVESKSSKTSFAWFGGGADLTPYYLFDEDIKSFHSEYRNICHEHFKGKDNDNDLGEKTYRDMKTLCDEYFYLPARAEHRGTGGIFFDDLMANPQTLAFVQSVADTWMPSWIPIVDSRNQLPYTEKQREWQLLRRGRYLEFNLLYDRGVKFGLAVENPRVEGVMVSAPPLIAWEYRHEVEEGSEEDRLMKILKEPINWV